FIKHDLGVQYYGRYVDDLILVHPDKEFLKECKIKIQEFLENELDLNLHPRKIFLQHFSKGVSFLGCYIKPNRTYINKRTKANFYTAIKTHNEVIRANKKISKPLLNKAISSVNSYLGILKHYDTYKLRKKMLFENLSAYYFNHLYISGNYGKMVPKIKIVKHKPY
ncbi:MAG: hypothetical protein KKA07_12545, partial [Bacteroidetes bacterium]|nr:hypothetical protein [Bacteroidota bacterium]